MEIPLAVIICGAVTMASYNLILLALPVNILISDGRGYEFLVKGRCHFSSKDLRLQVWFPWLDAMQSLLEMETKNNQIKASMGVAAWLNQFKDAVAPHKLFSPILSATAVKVDVDRFCIVISTLPAALATP